MYRTERSGVRTFDLNNQAFESLDLKASKIDEKVHNKVENSDHHLKIDNKTKYPFPLPKYSYQSRAFWGCHTEHKNLADQLFSLDLDRVDSRGLSTGHK